MDISSVNILSTILSVLGSIIPAIWFLSTKIQKLHGTFETQSSMLSEKISNLERQVRDISTQMNDVRKEGNELRERLVVVETLMESHSQQH